MSAGWLARWLAGLLAGWFSWARRSLGLASLAFVGCTRAACEGSLDLHAPASSETHSACPSTSSTLQLSQPLSTAAPLWRPLRLRGWKALWPPLPLAPLLHFSSLPSSPAVLGLFASDALSILLCSHDGRLDPFFVFHLLQLRPSPPPSLSPHRLLTSIWIHD